MLHCHNRCSNVTKCASTVLAAATAFGIVVVIVLFVASSGPAPLSSPPPSTLRAPVNPVQQHGQLSVKGNTIVDMRGQPVQLLGMSLFWSQWMGQFWNKDVVQWLASDWDAMVVRAAMGVEKGGYLDNPDTEKKKVMAVVEAAIAAGIYVIIDWHEENATQHVEQSMAFFGEMAKMYGKYPNVIFEPFNEPTTQSWSKQIKPYHEQIVPVIRQHSSNLIVLGTRTWSQRVDEASSDPVSGENLAYTLHFYAATHKGPLREIAKTALGNGAAIFVTEWGTCDASGAGTLDLAEAKAWLAFLAENNISAANWAIEDKDEACAALKPGASGAGGWPADQVAASGTFVRNYLRSPGSLVPTPAPTPAPPPAPPPHGLKYCDGRGSCQCDCTWASSSTCHVDDGSCCWGCCCSSTAGQLDPNVDFVAASTGNANLTVIF